jgi:hypothetical protein
MLETLRRVAMEGSIKINQVYLGHIKRDEDHKFLAHSEAHEWNDADLAIRGLLEQYLYQTLDGQLGEVNFLCMFTGETLSVDKVAPSEMERARNRPTVEILEAANNLPDSRPDLLLPLGNSLACKVMAAGAIRSHFVALLRLEIIPSLNADPIHFVFSTICDLDDREESLFDESRSRFVTTMLNNVVKRGSVSRSVIFPCLDDEGRELADMLVYAGASGGAWFHALEATRRLSPKREGKALVRMIAEQASGSEVSHDLFDRMGKQLLPVSTEGMSAHHVADSIEKAMGHGIDRKGFMLQWESTFGDLGYRTEHGSLFGGENGENPTKLKMQAGEIEVKLTPSQLEDFRRVNAGGQNFIVFAVPEQAKIVIGKDLDLRIRQVSPAELRTWMESLLGQGG